MTRRNTKRTFRLCLVLALMTLGFDINAELFSYTGTLHVESLPPAPPTTTAQGTVNVSPSGGFAFDAFSFSLAGELGGSFEVDLQNRIGTGFDFGLGPNGGFGGSMPMDGMLSIPEFQSCIENQLGTIGPCKVTRAVIGAGGSFGAYQSGARTLTGGFWTTGPTRRSWTFFYSTTLGLTSSARGFDTRTGYDDRTPDGAGRIQLISPIRVSSAIFDDRGNAFRVKNVGFAVLTVEFVPEPSELILFAAGVAGLGAIGFSRRHRGGPTNPPPGPRSLDRG